MRVGYLRAVAVTVLLLCAGTESSASGNGRPGVAAGEPRDDTVDWRVYKNRKLKFTINCPRAWSDTEVPIGSQSQVLFKPTPETRSKFFVVGVQVGVLPDPDLTLERAVNEMRARLPRLCTDVEIVEAKEVQVDGGPAHQIVFTGQRRGKALKQLMLLTIRENQLYLVSAVAPTAELFDERRQMIDEMLGSLRVGLPE